MKIFLSKSKYLSGLQCHKRLWSKVKTPERLSDISSSQQRIMDQGKEVGIKAHDYFHDGILVNSPNFEDAVKQTQELIETGATCIFEGAFIFEHLRVRCDIILKESDSSWKIIEVKSSTKVKGEHLHDLAYQNYILSELGMSISHIELMLINTKCIYPDLTNLFVSEDISLLANQLKDDVNYNVKTFITILNQDEEPNVPVGKHCDKPIKCRFKDHCWKDIPEYSIFTIPRISAQKKSDLVSKGSISIFDLPPDFPLTKIQRSYVMSVLSGKAYIDNKAIDERLSEYEYPIHFLDFETYNPAIPRFNGLRPYQQFPFQFSCHVWQSDGNITHSEFLHTDFTDPRLPFVESLVNLIAENGSIVVYYAPFERKILTDLVLFAPQYSSALESMVDRLEDQMDIFKNHYSHPGFLGSNSIKRVLPVLVPSLKYDDLSVKDGFEAQTIWDLMINATNKEEKSRMVDDLRTYCRMDTLAMVEIHKALLDI